MILFRNTPKDTKGVMSLDLRDVLDQIRDAMYEAFISFAGVLINIYCWQVDHFDRIWLREMVGQYQKTSSFNITLASFYEKLMKSL